jgi:hypothetical protein
MRRPWPTGGCCAKKKLTALGLHEGNNLRNSQPLISVKIFSFAFDKAIFQYSAHNSNSLISMLSHKNTVHIVTTKGMYGK